ncbi:GHKL domain-containing protein [Clostridium sp. 19966]|nr:GHKL domain-containing protein [Clostridium sp. 19966]
MIYGNIISSWELQLIIDVTSTLVLLLSLQNSIFIRKNYEDKFGVYQDKVLANQMEEVNSIYLTMRGWRHDYHNHMQKIKAHIAMNQIAEVKEYLNQLESDLDSIDVKYKSGNVSLDAILNSKLSVAEKLCININCKAAVPEKLSISDIDLCVIIGNLIDNAMEACENIKSGEKKFLRIYICVRKQQLYISVTNSTNELIRKLNKEYISSKRGNHGHGLKRIDNIVEKHEGFINRKNEPGVFATEIMLPLAQI